MADYQLRTGKAGEKVVDAYKKIENRAVSGYKSIENGVVSGYKKIEKRFVDAFITEVPVEDAFNVDKGEES